MRQPDARDSAWILAAALVLIALLMSLGSAVHPLVLGAAIQGVFLGVPLAYARLAGFRPLEASGAVRLGMRPLLLVLTASLGTMWLLKGVSDLALHFLPETGLPVEREVRQIEEQIGRAQEQGGLVAILVLVAAPALCEEVFFRGLLFRGLQRGLGPGWALVLTTLLFASFHGPWVQKAMMVVVGLYFGLVVWLTGSLWAGVAAHAANNLAVVGVTTLYGDRIRELGAPAWMLALSLGVFGLAIALLALERGGGSARNPQGSAPPDRPD